MKLQKQISENFAYLIERKDFNKLNNEEKQRFFLDNSIFLSNNYDNETISFYRSNGVFDFYYENKLNINVIQELINNMRLLMKVVVNKKSLVEIKTKIDLAFNDLDKENILKKVHKKYSKKLTAIELYYYWTEENEYDDGNFYQVLESLIANEVIRKLRNDDFNNILIDYITKNRKGNKSFTYSYFLTNHKIIKDWYKIIKYLQILDYIKNMAKNQKIKNIIKEIEVTAQNSDTLLFELKKELNKKKPPKKFYDFFKTDYRRKIGAKKLNLEKLEQIFIKENDNKTVAVFVYHFKKEAFEKVFSEKLGREVFRISTFFNYLAKQKAKVDAAQKVDYHLKGEFIDTYIENKDFYFKAIDKIKEFI